MLEAVPLLSAQLNTPLGPMIALAESRGLVLLEFTDRPILEREIRTLKKHYGYAPPVPGRNGHLAQIEAELAGYFAGTLFRFDVSLHMPGTPFDLMMWNALCAIPYGETRTYGEMAVLLGKPQASRAVGAANGRNRLAIVVPCHRLIGADGSLTGYGGGQARKAALLRLEHQAISH